jgi:hypothetical protein
MVSAWLQGIPKGVFDNPPLAWMPRLNFAWDVGGKGDLVVRAGAGLFYNRVQGNYDYYSSGQMPNTYSAVIDTPWASPTGLTFSDLKNVDPFSSLAAITVQSRDPNSGDLPRVAGLGLVLKTPEPTSLLGLCRDSGKTPAANIDQNILPPADCSGA